MSEEEQVKKAVEERFEDIKRTYNKKDNSFLKKRQLIKRKRYKILKNY